MAAITKEEYDFFKSQDPKDLTQEELNWMTEYEKAEAGAPSNEDMEWATFILNESDPRIQAINRKNGDFDKAMKLMNQSRAAHQVMQQKGQDPYVRKVTSTPDDVVKDSGFNFNWRNAYENVKNEKLRPTEADAKKLQDFINSNMYNVNDDVKLQQIAYNLHMYNPNTMKWSDFINSEQGAEFKKYLDDVRKAQTEKAVEDVWSGKDPVKVNYPLLGPTDIPFSKFLVDFALPVSKEYAKKHYNDKDFSLAGPLATDAAANLVMTGPGALPIKALKRPLISSVYGNVAAPAITEAGNVIFNDESIPEALARTVEGAAINIGTPQVLEGTLSWAGRELPTREGKRTVQKMIDEAANKATKVQNDIAKGKPFPYNEGQPIEFSQLNKDGKNVYEKFYSSDVPTSQKNRPSRKFESVKDMPQEAVTREEFSQLKQGLPFLRGKEGNSKFANTLKEIQDAGKEYLQDDLVVKKATALAKDGDLRNLTPSELRQLGFADKESFMNYLIRTIRTKAPSTLSSYLTNAAGRPEFGRRAGPIRNINYLLGTNLFGKDESAAEKQKSRIERLLGL